MILAIIIFCISAALFIMAAYAGYDILWPVKRPTLYEKQLYLEQDALIDKRVESEPVFNKLYWTPGRFDLISDKPSEKFIEYLGL